MNWKSGLFRVWLVASACWIALWALAIQNHVVPGIYASCVESACFAARNALPASRNPFDCFDKPTSPQNSTNPFAKYLPDQGQGAIQSCRSLDDIFSALRIHWPELQDIIVIAVTPSLVAMLFWWIGVWIAAGFRRTAG